MIIPIILILRIDPITNNLQPPRNITKRGLLYIIKDLITLFNDDLADHVVRYSFKILKIFKI